MVDGINIVSPRVPGTSENSGTVSKPSVASPGDKQVTQPPPKEARPVKSEASNNVSSAIAKSAEARLNALSTGNVKDYLQAAEKIISASLPSKPPGTKLRINLDDGSGRFVYQGIDVKTGDVVTQFPSDEVLKFVAFSREREGLEGIVVDEKA
ncbi:MAG: flagellar protein FlaG [Alphaproteobacteria bacterium]|nr:flagellar protein FlaG [Alphaproteobacteria bacterium]